MARFVSEHPNPWGWNPFPYCGLPTAFMYVPGLPYLTRPLDPPAAACHPGHHLSHHRVPGHLPRAGDAVPLRAHFTGSRRWSFAAAVAYSLLSPSYALFPAVEKDRGIAQLPWRIQVLAKYGEGPHNTGLMLLPLALLAALARRQKPRLSAHLRSGRAPGRDPAYQLGGRLRARYLQRSAAAGRMGRSGLPRTGARWPPPVWRTCWPASGSPPASLKPSPSIGPWTPSPITSAAAGLAAGRNDRRRPGHPR